jgi:hypothetical protein
MSRSGHKPNVALLAVPEGTASTIFGMYDLFSSVGRDWDMLHEGRPGTLLMAPRIAARDKAEMRVANGARLQPDITLEDDADPQIVCVPELLLMPDEPIADRFAGKGIGWRRRTAGGRSLPRPPPGACCSQRRVCWMAGRPPRTGHTAPPCRSAIRL